MRLAAIVTAVILALRLVPFAVPRARLWGFNHLLFASTEFFIIYIALAVLTLLCFLPPVATLAGNGYRILSGYFLSRQSPKRWLLAAIVALVAFWLLRLPVFLLGDSFSVTANLSGNVPVIFKWTESGAIFLAALLARFVSGETAYNLLSVLSGAATVFLFFGIAYELGRDQVERLLIVGLQLFAGWVVLFLGYTENYPVLWPFICGYIYFSLRYLKGTGGIVVPAVFLLAAMILHLQTVFFLISFAAVLFSYGRLQRFYRSHRPLILIASGIVVIALAAVAFWLYRHSLEFRMHVMPLTAGQGRLADYTLFSPAHLLDIANQLLLAVPLAPVLAVLARYRRREIFGDPIAVFLLFLSLGGLAFLFLVEPRLGMGRDWDLFALAGLAPLLFFARVAIIGDTVRRLAPALTLAALTLVLPFLAVNLDYTAAVDNYKYLLKLDQPRSRTGITILRDMYARDNQTAVVDSLNRALVAAFPESHLVPAAYRLMEQGDYERAYRIVDSLVLLDQFSIELYNIRGLISLKQGRYARAIQDLETAADLGRYDSRPLVNLAQAYSQLGQFNRMLEVLREAERRDPRSYGVAEGISSYYFARHAYDSALVYSRRMIELAPTRPSGYLVAGTCCRYLADDAGAEMFLNDFLRLAPDHPQAAQVREMLRAKK